MRLSNVAAVMLAPLLAAGCMARVGYTATVSNEGYGPELAYAAPGVQVIVDYDEPIFYVDSFYWRFYGGGWYRSPHYNGGWVYSTPPPAVRGIDRPQAYVHYRPAGWAGHREHGAPQPMVRGQPGRVEHAPGPPLYQQPPPRAAPPQWQPLPRGAPPQAPPRAAQPGPRNHDRHDDQGPRDHHGDGDHHDHRGDGDHHDRH